MTQRGEAHYAAKLTEPEVQEMRRMATAGMKIREIHLCFPQVSHVAVFNAIRRKTWRHVP